MSKINRLLIVKLSSIGDVVHTLPVSAAIKKSFPHIEITWIVEQMSAPMVMHNPYLSEVMVLPVEWRERVSVRAIKSFSKMRKDVKSRNFDMALDLQGLSKSAIVAWSSGAKYRFGYEWLRELAPHVITKIERRPQSIHIVDQFLDVAHFLGADVSNVEFPLVVTEEKMDAAVQKLSSLGICADEPYIVINPSPGGGGYKGLSADTFKDVVDALLFDPGYKIALVGSKSDAVVADEIVGHFPGKISSLCGQTDLYELTAILQRAALHLCGDTGSAHIAAAVGTKVVTVFGRSNPVRLAPYGQSHHAIHHREKCAEVCRKFHETSPINVKQKCFALPPSCLAAITAEEVVEMCRKVVDEVL